MKIKITLLAFFVLGLCLTVNEYAKADGMLFVAPTRVILNEKKKVEIINVSNVTDKPRTYKISIDDLVMVEAGNTVKADTFEFSAKKMIRFFPREFTVQPGQRQAIRVMARMPADTADGEYHSHIKFFEDIQPQDAQAKPGQASQASLKAAFTYSTLLPVIISKGKIETKIGWTDPKIIKGEKPDTYRMATKITREGNGQGNAYVDLIYNPPSGQPVQISKRRTVYVYREIAQRNFTFDFKLPEGTSPGGSMQMRLYTGDRSNPTLVNEVSQSIP